MDIFLAVLKITGISILILLAVLLLVILLALFAPVRYKILAEFNNDVNVSFRVKWLGGIIYFRMDYNDDKSGRVRVLGIPVGRKKKKKSKSDKNDNTKSKNTEIKSDKDDSKTPAVIKEKTDVSEGHSQEKNESQSKMSGSKKKQKRSKSKKSVFSNIRDIFKMIKDENNKRLFSFLKTQLFGLFKHVRPRYVKADMIIGLDDPADTGMLFGVIAIARGFVKGEYNIYPCFEEKKLEGRVKAKGHIMMFFVLRYLIQIYLNEDFKRVMRKGRVK